MTIPRSFLRSLQLKQYTKELTRGRTDHFRSILVADKICCVFLQFPTYGRFHSQPRPQPKQIEYYVTDFLYRYCRPICYEASLTTGIRHSRGMSNLQRNWNHTLASANCRNTDSLRNLNEVTPGFVIARTDICQRSADATSRI